MYAQVIAPAAFVWIDPPRLPRPAPRFTRERLVAACCALLFASVPYGIAYFQYASSYSVAILLTAAFLYLALRYIDDDLPGYFVLLLLTAAFAVHVNYLMWVLWITAAPVVVAAQLASASVPRRPPSGRRARPLTPTTSTPRPASR